MKQKRYKLIGTSPICVQNLDGFADIIRPGTIIWLDSNGFFIDENDRILNVTKDDLAKYFEIILPDEELIKLENLHKDILVAATQGMLANSSLTEDLEQYIMNRKHCCTFADISDNIIARAFHIADTVCKRYKEKNYE